MWKECDEIAPFCAQLGDGGKGLVALFASRLTREELFKKIVIKQWLERLDAKTPAGALFPTNCRIIPSTNPPRISSALVFCTSILQENPFSPWRVLVLSSYTT